MPLTTEPLPRLDDSVVPPSVCGTADLTGFAYQGACPEDVIARIERFHAGHGVAAARVYDMAIAAQLAFRHGEGLNLQDDALAQVQIFRVGADRASPDALRLLMLAAPGDLMLNTPLDFLTNALDVRLDLLYLLPDQKLPDVVPDHDVAFFAVSEADPETLVRLRALYATWPRPVLNDPGFLPGLARDALSRSLAGVDEICSPTAVAITRNALEGPLQAGRSPAGFGRGMYPRLIRPASSHAGSGLARIDSPAGLAEYLRFSVERDFFVTAFEDYSGPDGLFRKYRVAFIDRQPFLCHMAVSHNWMVHYLNAGMTESAEKRAEEAAAMAQFDTGFARRHAAAFAALHERLGFDFYSIDCAESSDGRLLVFEADVAAIIHLMDPPDLFPYKPPQMRRVFDAFGDLLRRRGASGQAQACPQLLPHISFMTAGAEAGSMSRERRNSS